MEKNINPIKNICVILTPFQLMQLSVLDKQNEIDVSNAFCFLAPIIKEEDVKKVLGNTVVCIPIPWKEVSLINIIKKPWTEIPKNRQLIEDFKQCIISSFDKYHITQVNLLLGTEKDTFTQVLMNKVVKEKMSNEIIAIDEGLGFYGRLSFKDKVWQLFYTLLTPLIFGMKIFYTSVLGVHPHFTKVYARFLDYLPYKRSDVSYCLLNSYKSSIVQNVQENKKILLFTSPLAEDHHCSIGEEKKILNDIFEVLCNKGYELFLKPHPREDIEKYNDFLEKYSIKYISKENSAETLDYFDFNKILHFGSSVILDLYQRKYPLNHIITLDTEYNYHELTQSMYQKGVYLRLFSKNLREEIKSIL